jgi:cytochrome b pre-mRNA-processing protein 3
MFRIVIGQFPRRPVLIVSRRHCNGVPRGVRVWQRQGNPKMLPFSSRTRAGRQTAERIYAASVEAARRPEFYLQYGVPDTLQGRFEMLALHLFPVLHRLMHDPGDDPELARLVSEVLVSNTEGAFREMGVGDTVVPKRMKTFYQSFAGRISAYKEALDEGGDALVAAIGRNVFADAGEDRHVRALAGYLEESVEAIRAVDVAVLKRGELPYPALQRQTELIS